MSDLRLLAFLACVLLFLLLAEALVEHRMERKAARHNEPLNEH